MASVNISDDNWQSSVQGAHLTLQMKQATKDPATDKWTFEFDICIGTKTVHVIKGRYSELKKQHGKHPTTLGCADALKFPDKDFFLSRIRRATGSEREVVEEEKRDLKEYFEAVLDIRGYWPSNSAKLREVHSDMGISSEISEEMLEAVPLSVRASRWPPLFN
jgi:hypothetical protein